MFKQESRNRWLCTACLLAALPSADVFDENSVVTTEDDRGEEDECLPGYQEFALRHPKKFKMGHININSIAGFKFFDVKRWLELSLFDVLIISETKLDMSFPNSQFEISGYRMIRKDRDRHGGGIIMYLRSDIPYSRLNKIEQSVTGIECIAIRLKIAKVWTTVIGAYRPPSLAKLLWRKEMFDMFELAADKSRSVFVLGDLNCDLLHPDKPPKDGRDLLDIMDMFNYNNVIGSATRITHFTETLIDLILTNTNSRVLKAGVVNPEISDPWFLLS